eukprot:7583-Pelagomonas_calceolata.AAC.1
MMSGYDSLQSSSLPYHLLRVACSSLNKERGALHLLRAFQDAAQPACVSALQSAACYMPDPGIQ